MRAKKALWTAREEEVLRQWFGKRTADWIARILERSPQAVRYHAWKLRLKGRRGKPWRGEEEEESAPKTRRWLNPTVEHLARRSGFNTVRAYLTFLARKKGYHAVGFRRTLTRTLAKLERAGQRVSDWTEQEWAAFFHRVGPPKKLMTVETGRKRLRAPKRSNWTSEGFGGYIHLKLRELNKPASWLAQEAGISKQAVHLYLCGWVTPRKALQAKIVDILESSTKVPDTSSHKEPDR